VLPVIRDVLAKAPGTTAVDAFRAQYRLQALKKTCDAVLDRLDFVLTPSFPRPVTLDELARDPIGPNSLLGYYTNFMNLLDYAAIATPAGFMRNGLPWGVTLFGRAFTDQYLLSVADALHRKLAVPLIGGAQQSADTPARAARNDRMKLVVCGAHLEGLALNGQLIARGARLVEKTASAPRYRLYALAGGGATQRPGMTRDAANGAAIEVEIWELPSSEAGSFLTGIPAPLALGKVELADGRWETGFVCEAYGLEGAVDITQYGGWRAWLKRAT
jgi:allophanate hydrolase